MKAGLDYFTVPRKILQRPKKEESVPIVAVK